MITAPLIIKQLRLRHRLLRKSVSEGNNKCKTKTNRPGKTIYPEELIAAIASILIIVLAYIDLGLAI